MIRKLTKAELAELVEAGAQAEVEAKAQALGKPKASPVPRTSPLPQAMVPQAKAQAQILAARDEAAKAQAAAIKATPQQAPRRSQTSPATGPAPGPRFPEALGVEALARDSRGRLEALQISAPGGRKVQASIADRDSFGNLQALVLRAGKRRIRLEVLARDRNQDIRRMVAA